jgi:hypothetical protein
MERLIETEPDWDYLALAGGVALQSQVQFYQRYGFEVHKEYRPFPRGAPIAVSLGARSAEA